VAVLCLALIAATTVDVAARRREARLVEASPA
jgi:hypothetical protein